MHLIAVGKLRTGPERSLFDQYNARLRPKLEVIEVAEAAGAPAEVKRRETRSLLAALPDNAQAIALDIDGETFSSEAFAAQLRRWLERARPLAFLLGGTEGLDSAAIERADAVLSLGSMTWPHKLARVLLVEQLYRAQSILLGHPYHRSGRPKQKD